MSRSVTADEMKSVRAGAMKSVWRALWVLCLSACVCKRVCVSATQGEDILEDNGLLRLNKGNFDQALKLYQPLLVQFCKYVCVCVCVCGFAVI